MCELASVPLFPNFSPISFPLIPVQMNVSEFVIGTAKVMSEKRNALFMYWAGNTLDFLFLFFANEDTKHVQYLNVCRWESNIVLVLMEDRLRESIIQKMVVEEEES